MKNWLLFGLFSICLMHCQSSTNEEKSGTDTTSASAPGAASTETAHDPYLCIPCEQVGKVKPSYTEEDLKQIVGQENVSRDSVFVEGNFEGMATVLWDGKPEEIWIHWTDSTFQKMSYIEITQPNSPFHMPNGVKIGTPLQELVKLNGKHFNFSGFGWDYGGGCMGFEGGKLDTELPCLNITLDMGSENYSLSEPEMNSIMGDQPVSSSNKALEKVQVKVVSLYLSFEKNP